MYTWLSRVMTFVFLFNVLSPAYAQNTAARRRNAPIQLPGDPVAQARKEAQLAQSVADQTWEARQEYLAQITPRREEALAKFLEATTFEEMDAAYKELQQIRAEGAAGLQQYRDKFISYQTAAYDAGSQATSAYYQQNPHVAPDAVNQTMRASRQGYDLSKNAYIASAHERMLGEYALNCFSADNFLKKLQNNEFESVEEMVEFIDPVSFNCPVDNLAIAYAAESLFYAVDGFMYADSIPEDQREELAIFFAHLNYRASEALKRLNASSQNPDEKLYMARGSVRLLLAILPQIMAANNLQLPEKKLYLVSPTKKTWNQICSSQPAKSKSKFGEMDTLIYVNNNLMGMSCKSYEQYVKDYAYVVDALVPEIEQAASNGLVKVEEINSSSANYNLVLANYFQRLQKNINIPDVAYRGSLGSLTAGRQEDLGAQFYHDFLELKNKKPEADSKEIVLLNLVVQYAAQYAVLTGESTLLSQMLAGLEGKPNSDFKTVNSEVIATIFNSVYETLRGFNVQESWHDAFIFLMDAAKDTHAPGTRVLALMTLGMLTEETDSTSEPILRAEFISDNGENTNKYWLSYAERFTLGQYVADLYGPLNGYYYGMKDYGLSSEEMVSLADELSNIYVQFLPLEAPTVTLGRCGRIEKTDMDNRRILQVWEFLQTEQGVIRDADCQVYYSNGGVFVFSSKGVVEMSKLNFRNAYKYRQEMTNKGMELFGESLMWVFGGALIGTAFKGLRLLYGVSKALPRAIRSGKIVYNATKGSRAYRWTAAVKRAQGSMKVGSKYMSNFNYQTHLARNGMGYAAEAEAATPAGVVKAGTFGPVPPSPVTRVSITAADPASGLARQASVVVPSSVAKLPLPLQRAWLLRTAQQYGLRNTWSAIERGTFERSVMWRNAYDKLWHNYADGKLVRFGEPFVLPEGSTLPYYPGSVLAEHPMIKGLWKGYWSTLRFFGLWKLGDIGVGLVSRDSFNGWMVQKQEDASRAEMNKYPSLSDEKMAEMESAIDNNASAAPGDLMNRVGGVAKEGWSWMDVLTWPTMLWQSVAPAREDPTDGSMIFPPATWARYAFLKDDAFINDAIKQQISLDANRMALASANISKTNKVLGETAESWLQAIEEQRASVKQLVANFTQYDPGFNWQKDVQGIVALLDSTEKALQDIQKDPKVTSRSQQLQDLTDNIEAELMGKWDNLNNNIVNSQIDELIAQFTQAGLFMQLSMQGNNVDPQVIAKGQNLYAALIKSLKQIKAQRFNTFEEKQKAIEKCIDKFEADWAADVKLSEQLSAIINAEYSQPDSEDQNDSESSSLSSGNSDRFDAAREEFYADEDPEEYSLAY